MPNMLRGCPCVRVNRHGDMTSPTHAQPPLPAPHRSQPAVVRARRAPAPTGRREARPLRVLRERGLACSRRPPCDQFLGCRQDVIKERGRADTASSGERGRLGALCLVLLGDRVTWHGEAFHFAREKFAEAAQGTPGGELATGLTAVVLGDTGGGEYPPSAQARLAAVDAALERIATRARETGERLVDRPDTAALRTLRALAAEDREAFDAALADLLVGHSTLHAPSASARSLLPLVPIALAALAYRTLGWARPPSGPTTSRTR
ncbi:Imm49 family immunity protein [Streptomyces griseomycini]|uniref:Imm49 family immunity protein n=1 Tax=Streptomyces griseomycini TaxID=66895 RepID=UPI0034224DCE